MRAISFMVPMAFVLGCHASETTGTARQAIGNTDGAVAVASINTASEPSACWSPTVGPGGDTVCVGYNSGGASAMGWSWSPDQGKTWNGCRSDNPAGCNGASGLDAGGPTSGGAWVFSGDPTVVADKLGNVVYVSMADDSGNPCSPQCAKRVVAAVSNDGGRTFGPSPVLVNDGHCGDGGQDQPDATFDLTTNPPTLWVAWRHGGSTMGVCARRGYLSGSQIVWMGDAQDVDGMGVESMGWGEGGVRIRAGDGVVTVVYSNTDQLNNCPSTDTNAFAIEAVTSYNNAVDWVDRSRLFHSDNWLSCVLPKNSSYATVEMQLRMFDFARAPDGSYYVVAQQDPSNVRLFFNRTSGARPTYGSDETRRGWREWCPGTPTGGTGSPVANWTAPGVECATRFFRHPSGLSLAWPTIAVDDRGALALWYYEARALDDVAFHVKYWSNATPRDPSSGFGSLTLSPDFTPGNGGGGYRVLGDYEAMTVVNGLGAPKCGASGTMVPIWTRADIDASPAVAAGLQASP